MEQNSGISIARQRIIELKALQARSKEGKFNAIPFPLQRLSQFVPGIIKGMYYGVTAGTGEGKTQFTKFLFVKSVLKFMKQNPNTGVKPRILYFCLEESKQEFIDSYIIDLLWEKHQIKVDPYQLESRRIGGLSDDLMKKIENCILEVEELEKYVEIIDTVANPTGIYKYIKGHSRAHGTHYYTQLRLDDENRRTFITENVYFTKSDNEKENWKYSHYVPTDPEEHVIIIIDHMGLLNTERGAETMHASMQRMSADYVVMQIIKHFSYSVVAVHQQIMTGQDIQYLKEGAEKPTMAKLGDNKLIGRDYKVLLGLYSPYKHEKKRDNGYNIEKLKDYYINLSLIKHRKGKSNIEMGLFFNGIARHFEDLPETNDAAGLEVFYNRVRQLERIDY